MLAWDFYVHQRRHRYLAQDRHQFVQQVTAVTLSA
jgi:hypothetical protein